jgi:hypothetical protein
MLPRSGTRLAGSPGLAVWMSPQMGEVQDKPLSMGGDATLEKPRAEYKQELMSMGLEPLAEVSRRLFSWIGLNVSDIETSWRAML